MSDESDEYSELLARIDFWAQDVAYRAMADDLRAMIAELRQHPVRVPGATDCGHYFHSTTAMGHCTRCGGSWKKRHQPLGGNRPV